MKHLAWLDLEGIDRGALVLYLIIRMHYTPLGPGLGQGVVDRDAYLATLADEARMKASTAAKKIKALKRHGLIIEHRPKRDRIPRGVRHQRVRYFAPVLPEPTPTNTCGSAWADE